MAPITTISRLKESVGTLLLALAWSLFVAGCSSPGAGNRGGSPRSVPINPGMPSQPVRPTGELLPQGQHPVSLAAWRQEADKWMGTQYLEGGMDHRGIDCSGLTWQIYRAVTGVTLPHNAARQFSSGIPIAPDTLRPGDLIFFAADGAITHVGLSLGGDQFVHASTHRGVIISSIKDPYYAKRLYGAKRLVP